jgi:CRP-like cAMP-binding protein
VAYVFGPSDEVIIVLVDYTSQEVSELISAGLCQKISIELVPESTSMELLKSDYRVIAQICNAIRFTSGQILFYEGDIGANAYLIMQGMVGVNRNDDVDVLNIGNLIGKIGSNEASTRCATVTCITDGIALEIGYNELQEIVFKYPQIGLKFASIYKEQIEIICAL